MSLKAKTIINTPISSNCHILYDGLKRRGLIIDPGSENIQEILSYVNDNKIIVDYVILTHEHFDHIWSADKFNASVICSQECANNIVNNKKNLSFFFRPPGFSLEITVLLIEDIGMMLQWQGYNIEFIKNKAHSPGGILFTIDNYIVTGDMLIKDTKTTTKLPLSQVDDLEVCESWLLSKKGNNYIVLAGHGDNFELDHYNLKKIY